MAQITYQSLFKLYPKLSGMTGTAKTEVHYLFGRFLDNFLVCIIYAHCSNDMIILVLQEKEFLKMFKMPVIEVPTNLPNIRVDLPIQAFAARLLRRDA